MTSSKPPRMFQWDAVDTIHDTQPQNGDRIVDHRLCDVTSPHVAHAAPLCASMTSSTKPEVHTVGSLFHEADRTTAIGLQLRLCSRPIPALRLAATSCELAGKKSTCYFFCCTRTIVALQCEHHVKPIRQEERSATLLLYSLLVPHCCCSVL